MEAGIPLWKRLAYVAITRAEARLHWVPRYRLGKPTEALRKELRTWVRTEIGPIAAPDLIQWAPGLPKTRSGKIMRRILRKIAENDYGALGDTSTLAEPAVVDDLIENRMNKG